MNLKEILGGTASIRANAENFVQRTKKCPLIDKQMALFAA